MPKTRTKYICQQCGGEQNKWVGKCPDCGSWNTMEEVTELPQSPAQQRRRVPSAPSRDSGRLVRLRVRFPEVPNCEETGTSGQ